MRDYSLLFGLAALGLIVGCQQSPPPQRPAAAPQVSAAVASGEADRLMERGDYGKAAGRYQEAVALEPDDMRLRFALGTAYSHLGRRAEAAEEFQWVVERGDPGADYLHAARQWLVSAGMLSDERTSSAGTDAAVESQAQQPTKGTVAGPLEWPGVSSQKRLIEVKPDQLPAPPPK